MLVGRALGLEHRTTASARQQLSDFSDLTRDRQVLSPLALASERQTFRLVGTSLRLAMPVPLDVPKEDRPPTLK
jgi:hypothetical protein